MKTLAMALMVAFLAIAVSGCGLVDGLDEAKTQSEGYFEALRVGDYDRAVTYYSPLAFESSGTGMSERQVRELLLKAHNRLGDLQSYSLVGLDARTYFGTDRASGSYYALTYEVEYAKASATETIMLFKPSSAGDGGTMILEHNIEVTDLLN